MVTEAEAEAPEQVFETEEKEGAEVEKAGYMCRFCPAGPFTTAQRRQRHERRDHKEEYQQHQIDRKATKAAGGLDAAAMSERTRMFAEIIEATAPELKSNQRMNIIKAFEDDSSVLSTNSHELENFLDDMGLTVHQIRVVVRRMIGRARREGLTEEGGANNPVMALDPRTGQQIPVFIVNNPSGGNQPQGYPPIIMPGWGKQEETLSARDIADLVEESLDRRETKLKAETPPTKPNVRRFQEPIVDPEGNFQTDSEGNPLVRWVEEPVDPLLNTITVLGKLGMLAKTESLTAEDIVRALQQVIPQDTRNPEMEGLKDEFREFRHAVEKKDTAEDAARAATDSLMERIGPQLKELEDVRSRGNMSDEQASMVHQEKLIQHAIGAIEGLQSSMRTDIQPMILPLAAASMKGMGLSESTINNILTSLNTPVASPEQATAANAAAAMSRWVKD